jgi:uncharacterized protein (DUF305 family)
MTIKKTTIIALVVAGGLAASGLAVAQSMQHGGHGAGGGMHHEMHAGMHMGGGMHGNAQGGHGRGHGGYGPSQERAAGDQSVSTLAFAAVNEKMHRDMGITFSGNTDVDFARGMIPHHQGAVDMAKIVLAFGKDPEIRKLAEDIVKSQEAEIAFMQAWLKKQGK